MFQNKEVLSKSSTNINKSIESVLKIKSFNNMLEKVKVTISKNKIKIGKREININTDRGEETILSLSELLVLTLGGYIIPYENNRGQSCVKNSTVNSIRDNYNPTVFGHITVCWDSKLRKFIMCDFHHRMLGYLKRILENKNKPIEFFDKVSMTIGIPDKVIETYQAVNMNKAHGTADHASNPDLVSGKAIMDIKGEMPDEHLEFFEKEFTGSFLSRALNNNIYCLIREGTKKVSKMDFADISSRRSLAQKFSKEKATLRNSLSRSQIETIVNGLGEYYKVFNNTNLNITDKSLDVSIRKSQYLVGIMVQHQFNPRQFSDYGSRYSFHRKYDEFASSLTRNAKDISELLSLLGRGSEDAQRKLLHKFVKILRR